VGDLKADIRKKTKVEINDEYFEKYKAQDQQKDAEPPAAGVAEPEGGADE